MAWLCRVCSARGFFKRSFPEGISAISPGAVFALRFSHRPAVICHIAVIYGTASSGYRTTGANRACNAFFERGEQCVGLSPVLRSGFYAAAEPASCFVEHRSPHGALRERRRQRGQELGVE